MLDDRLPPSLGVHRVAVAEHLRNQGQFVLRRHDHGNATEMVCAFIVTVPHETEVSMAPVYELNL
jgi:hypothetical protein